MKARNKKINTCLSLIWIVLCLILSLVFSGCGKKNSAVEEKTQGYRVTDSSGAQMTFSSKPQRIVSLSISTDEILLDLVETNRIAGLSGIVDIKGISNVTDRAKAVKGRAYSSNMENVLCLKPDLIIAPDFCPLEMVQTYRDMGINIYLYRTPSNIPEIQKIIKDLAHVVGEVEKGEQINKNMKDKLDFIKSKTGDIALSEQRRVILMDTNGARFQLKSSFSNICSYAAVRDATQELNYDKMCLLGQEEILRLNPDIFMLSDWNYDGEHDANIMKNQLLSNPSYQTTSAGKNKAVLSISAARLWSLSQFTADAALDIAKAVYPERF